MTMNYSISDAKLKTLIKLCKQTGNNKKLAVVSFILTGNLLDEIGAKLGIRARNKSSDENEHIYRYMELINIIMETSLKISIFNEEHIKIIQTIELQFIKQKGELPMEYIKKMFKIYYKIRTLNIPNLHKTFKDEMSQLHSDTNMYALMSPSASKGRHQPDKLKSLILHKIREHERDIRNELKGGFNKDLFESAVYLKNVRKSVEDPKQSKVQLRGALKDNINYQQSLNDIYGFTLIGLSIVLFLLGIMVVIQAAFHPSLAGPTSILLLSFFSSGCFFLYLYWNFFKKEVK
jgi:hypothetical protein